MLSEFLDANRTVLVARCCAAERLRPALLASSDALGTGLSAFLEMVIGTLRSDRAATPAARDATQRYAGAALHEALALASTSHGARLRRLGFTVREVVHSYECLGSTMFALASESGTAISSADIHSWNRCLDAAVTDAISGWFGTLEPIALAAGNGRDTSGRLSELAYELRESLASAMLSFSAIKSGSVAIGGATSGALDRSHEELRRSIDRALADVQYVEALQRPRALLELDWLAAELKIACADDAAAKGCRFEVESVEPGLALCVDKRLIVSAITTLLKNAFKFTRPGGRVRLKAYSVDERVLIEIEDECGGLPPGKADTIMLPFTRRGEKNGLGLGLSISRREIEACDGLLRWRDLPL
ncbi:MAG TPA: sensor histidine kinase, partial [Candidatus Saccharimonadia bacterium]|nr:sensor histidine kinase [Candidatus Saccharimonadia bacterium]